MLTTQLPIHALMTFPLPFLNYRLNKRKVFLSFLNFSNTLKNICIGIHFNGSFWHTVCSLNRIMNCLAGIFREYCPKFSEKRFYETVSNRLHVFHNQSSFSVQAKEYFMPACNHLICLTVVYWLQSQARWLAYKSRMKPSYNIFYFVSNCPRKNRPYSLDTRSQTSLSRGKVSMSIACYMGDIYGKSGNH